MPIIEVEPRLREGGRIRIGELVTKTNDKGEEYSFPGKLGTFRFTSEDRASLVAIAARYGGTVTEWADAPEGEQHQVVTEATSVDVLWPATTATFTQWLELWSGGGCQRRCDGETEQITGKPCMCGPAESRECKPHTRLSVILTGLESIGVWRLDTQGWNAAAELKGATDLAMGLGGLVPGRLLLRQEVVKKPGEKPRHFVVPALDLTLGVEELAPGRTAPAVGPARAAIPPQSSGPSTKDVLLGQLKDAFVAAGYEEARYRKAFLVAIAGRPLPSADALTEDELEAAIAGLRNLAKLPPDDAPPPAADPVTGEVIEAQSFEYAPGEEPF